MREENWGRKKRRKTNKVEVHTSTLLLRIEDKMKPRIEQIKPEMMTTGSNTRCHVLDPSSKYEFCDIISSFSFLFFSFLCLLLDYTF